MKKDNCYLPVKNNRTVLINYSLRSWFTKSLNSFLKDTYLSPVADPLKPVCIFLTTPFYQYILL